MIVTFLWLAREGHSNKASGHFISRLEEGWMWLKPKEAELGLGGAEARGNGALLGDFRSEKADRCL